MGTMKIPPFVGLPERDLFRNDKTLKVSALAVEGSFDPIPVELSPPTGPFFDQPIVKFGPDATAGQLTSIALNVTMSVGMEVGDEITLSLPEFTSDMSRIDIAVESILPVCTQICRYDHSRTGRK